MTPPGSAPGDRVATGEGAAGPGAPGVPAAGRVAAVVVSYRGDATLPGCVASLHAEGIARLVLVDNSATDPSRPDAVVARVAAENQAVVVVPGRNVGYGAGANRGVAATGGEMVLVCNADLVLHPGVVKVLVGALDADPSLAVVGPRVLDADGTQYPSARRFPSLADAVGHAFLGLFAPRNRFTRRYQRSELCTDRTVDGGPAGRTTVVDWVSGSCFLARRNALEEVGGFDESYFMYAEDVDLCWRLHRAGWRVGFVPAATVTHVQGVSTARHPYRMLAAHHRSAFRFASRSATGAARLLLPVVAAGLAARFLLVCAREALRGTSPLPGATEDLGDSDTPSSRR